MFPCTNGYGIATWPPPQQFSYETQAKGAAKGVQAVQAVQGVQGVQAAQAPAWNGAAPQKGAMPGKGGRPGPQAPAITVTGCRNPTVANIVNGVYNAVDTNHGKPVYKKEASPTNVLIYFWDERDGATFGGWWLGPKVGGDQVWAYSMNKTSSLPPANGWKVPWDGPVDDSLVLSYGGKGSSQGLQQPQQQPQPPAAAPVESEFHCRTTCARTDLCCTIILSSQSIHTQWLQQDPRGKF